MATKHEGGKAQYILRRPPSLIFTLSTSSYPSRVYSCQVVSTPLALPQLNWIVSKPKEKWLRVASDIKLDSRQLFFLSPYSTSMWNPSGYARHLGSDLACDSFKSQLLAFGLRVSRWIEPVGTCLKIMGYTDCIKSLKLENVMY